MNDELILVVVVSLAGTALAWLVCIAAFALPLFLEA